jgi:hypothetical protein
MDKLGTAGLGVLLVLAILAVLAVMLVYWSWRGLKKGFFKMVMDPKCY